MNKKVLCRDVLGKPVISEEDIMGRFYGNISNNLKPISEDDLIKIF